MPMSNVTVSNVTTHHHYTSDYIDIALLFTAFLIGYKYYKLN